MHANVYDPYEGQLWLCHIKFLGEKKHYKADEKNAIYSFELSVCVKNLHRYTNTVFD